LLNSRMDICRQRKYFDAKKYPKVAGRLERVHERPAYKTLLETGLG
jgi:hypothetical protein